LEEKFLTPYTSDIRSLAGHLNLMGSIAKNERASGFGRHIYDHSLL
jgi:hypothetical protein